MQNTSGISPVEYNVLVKVEKVEKVTAGGIIKPDSIEDRQNAMFTKGVLVAVSPLAFTYERWPEGSRKPRPGDRVMITKAAGREVDGEDGEKYKILKDKDIEAILVPMHNTIAGLEADIAEANAEVA